MPLFVVRASLVLPFLESRLCVSETRACAETCPDLGGGSCCCGHSLSVPVPACGRNPGTLLLCRLTCTLQDTLCRCTRSPCSEIQGRDRGYHPGEESILWASLIPTSKVPCPILPVHSIPCNNSRASGVGYPTEVPHSQPDTARRPPVVAPSCQPQLSHRPLHHGVPRRGEVGDLGRCHPRDRERVFCQGLVPGERGPTRRCSGSVQASRCLLRPQGGAFWGAVLLTDVLGVSGHLVRVPCPGGHAGSHQRTQ